MDGRARSCQALAAWVRVSGEGEGEGEDDEGEDEREDGLPGAKRSQPVQGERRARSLARGEVEKKEFWMVEDVPMAI